MTCDTHLTPRQLEVIHILSEGYGERRVQEKLALAHHTVTNHVTDIKARLRARSATHAAAMVARCERDRG